MNRRRVFWGGAAILAAALVPAGYIDSVDAGSRLELTRAIVERFEFSIPDEQSILSRSPETFVRGQTDRILPKYWPGLSVFWLPFYSVGFLAGRTVGLSPQMLGAAAVSTVNVLVTLATCGILFAMNKLVTGSGRASPGMAAVYLAGTPALAYANSCFSEPVVGLLVLLAFAIPLRSSSPWALVASAACGGAAATVKPEFLLLFVGLIAVHAWSRRGIRTLLHVSLGFFALPILAMLHRVSVLGQPGGSPAVLGTTPSDYAVSGFGTPWRALGLYLGLGDESLWVYFPGLIAGLYGWLILGRRRETAAIAAGVGTTWVLLLFVYSSWHDPGAGMSFGPRFFVSLAPVTLLPAGLAVERVMKARLLTGDGRLAWKPAVGLLLLMATIFQVAGMSVRDHQADPVAARVGISKWETKVRLFAMKLSRGVGGNELYVTSDFRKLLPVESDAMIDQTRIRTYQFLNHWWSLMLANRVRGLGAVVEPDGPRGRSATSVDTELMKRT